MSTLPGWSLSAALERKQDAQLAAFGQSFEYVPISGANFLLSACKDEGSREGDKRYFRLHAKPSAFAAHGVTVRNGDRILTPERVWYVAIEHAVEDGWQVILFEQRGPA